MAIVPVIKPVIPVINGLLGRMLANKHTTIAGSIYGGIKMVVYICKVWMPQYSEKLDKTSEIIEAGAVFYGFSMAGDASQSMSRADADTAFVHKPTTNTP